jgi:glucose/arabinose dehydrogenase
VAPAPAAAEAPPGAEPRASDRPTPSSGDAAKPAVRVTKLLQLPALATSLAAVPGSDEILVADRAGVIRRLVRRRVGGFRVPTLASGLVLDLSKTVTMQFDRGFLNMAFVNDGTSLVVMYTGTKGELRFEQYPYRPGKPIDRSKVRVLAALPWDYPLHHGGGLALDADGDLLVGLGDKGAAVNVLVGAESDLVLGGITEIPRRVLEDPALPWAPKASEMLARGLRNPWRMSIDAKTGDVYIGDVGNLDYEEVNRIPAGDVGARQLNFGHPLFEGPKRLYDQLPEGIELTAPAIARKHGKDVCGMVSGYVYRGDLIAGLDGRFVYTDLCAKEVRSFRLGPDGTATDDRSLGELPEGLVAISRGPSGELYGLGYQGGVYRLDPAWWAVDDIGRTTTGPEATTQATRPLDERPASCPTIEKIFQAIEPLDAIAGKKPEVLKEQLTSIRAEVERLVPELPADLVVYGQSVERVLRVLDETFRASDYVVAESRFEALSKDLLDGTGDFAGFPEAMVAFSDVGCG